MDTENSKKRLNIEGSGDVGHVNLSKSENQKKKIYYCRHRSVLVKIDAFEKKNEENEKT